MDVSWSKKMPKIPEIPAAERTGTMLEVLEVCCRQQELLELLVEEVQALKDEIARLKGQKGRPKILPSKLEKDSAEERKAKQEGKRPGSQKRSKTAELTIHREEDVRPTDIPQGSIFKGYEYYTVQDLLIRPVNTRYRLERWLTPSGTYLVGKAPQELDGGHFGPTLLGYVLYQYYHAHVTAPLLLEQLLELGVEISAGQLSRILVDGKDRYHQEKAEILRVGLEVSGYVHADDTTARHEGRNGFCTHIGNELFAWFESTPSKSRINFLQLLRGEHTDYVLNDEAIQYMQGQGLALSPLSKLELLEKRRFEDKEAWEAALGSCAIASERHVQIATEGALLGSVLEHGVPPELVIISDDAGQFCLMQHALCWIHAERTIKKLVGYTDEQRAALEKVLSELWELYRDLKAYKQEPGKRKKKKLSKRFDELFTQKTCYASLNLALERIHKNKNELLLVLERPEVPLNNNLSEQDIREYVKRRKVSGSTRSELGRRCRDTFTSLKKTCRKLGVSFWQYLQDRLRGLERIPSLGELIRQRARDSPL
jgi:hypothetical protein